jgi:hypothetical protein
VSGLLIGLDGVAKAEVNHETGAAVITMKPGSSFPESTARDALEADLYELKAVVRR